MIDYNFEWDLQRCFIIRHLISKIIVMPKKSLTVFTNDPSVTKDQALEETVLTLFDPVIHSCFLRICQCYY